MIGRQTITLAGIPTVLFGGTFVAVKAGLEYFPPLLFVAIRYDVAAVVLGTYVVLTTSREDLVPRTVDDALGIFATGVLTIGLANAFLFVGQQYATSAVGAIVFSLNPILTPVFAAVLLSDERLSVRGAAGLVLGLVGVGLVVAPDPANLLAGGFGKAILFTGAVSGALGTVLIRRADSSLSSTVRVAWGLPFGALLCHALSLATGEPVATVTLVPEALVALVYVGVFSGALAYVAYFDLIDTTGAIRANLIHYVVPVVTTLGGWALLGERLSALAVVGFLTIFAGFAVMAGPSMDVRSVLAGVVNGREPGDGSSAVCDQPRGFRAD